MPYFFFRVLAASASETYDPWHDIFQDGNFEPSQYLTPDLVAQLHEHNQEKPLDERKKSDRTNSLEYETEYYYEYDAGSPQSGQETKNAPPAAIAAAEEEEEQEYEYYYYDEEERKEEEEEKKEEQAVQKPRQQVKLLAIAIEYCAYEHKMYVSQMCISNYLDYAI